MNIQKKLRELGYNSVPQTFYSLAQLWESWYIGNAADFHTYKVYNGIEYIDCRRYSVGMAKKVCEDWANLLLNEKVSITLEGEAEQAFVDEVLLRNNFRVKGNEMQERKAAVGTVAYVARVDGVTVRDDTGEIIDAGEIKLDYCDAQTIYPLSWDNGMVRECAFCTTTRHDGKEYTYMQMHLLEGGKYKIENRMFEGSKAVPLGSLPGYENVPEVIYTDSDMPQFILDRLNIANPDYNNPMGVAVFANAIDQLKGVDIAYDAYVNEFVLGKKRIVVKPEAARDINGRPVFDAAETVYYALPEDSDSGTMLQQVDMTLRTAEFNAGMQDMLNMLSSKCGFGEAHYKFDRGNIATATQVVAENSTLFRTVKKHELVLEEVLLRLCRTILRMGNKYMGLSLNEEVEISIDFDDSIIEDKQAEFARDLQMLSAGILNDWEFRMKWLNEDEQTARAALPGMDALTTEGQSEVE